MRQYFVSGLLFLSLLAALYFLFFDSGNVDFQNDQTTLVGVEGIPRIPSPRERVMLDIPPESISTVKFDSLLYDPRDVIVKGDEIYISDPPSYSVKRFKLDGTYLSTIGKGPGRGPGEITESADFVIDDSFLWLTGPNLRRVVKYTLDGRYVDQFQVDKSPFRLARVANSLIVNRITSFDLISSYSLSGSLLREYGADIANQGGFLSVLGHMDTDGSNVFFASQFASYIFEYSDRGVLTRIIETVDRLPFPSKKVEKNTSNQPAMRAPEQDTVVVDIEIDNDLIYLDTAILTSPRYTIIDVYQLKTGRYVSSARLPFFIYRMDVADGRVYATRDTTVVTFDFPFAD